MTPAHTPRPRRRVYVVETIRCAADWRIDRVFTTKREAESYYWRLPRTSSFIRREDFRLVERDAAQPEDFASIIVKRYAKALDVWESSLSPLLRILPQLATSGRVNLGNLAFSASADFNRDMDTICRALKPDDCTLKGIRLRCNSKTKQTGAHAR